MKEVATGGETGKRIISSPSYEDEYKGGSIESGSEEGNETLASNLCVRLVALFYFLWKIEIYFYLRILFLN